MKWDKTPDWIDVIKVGIRLKDLHQFFKYFWYIFTVISFKREEIYQDEVNEMDKIEYSS